MRFLRFITFFSAAISISFAANAQNLPLKKELPFNWQVNQGIDYPVWLEILPHEKNNQIIILEIDNRYELAHPEGYWYAYPENAFSFVQSIGNQAFKDGNIEVAYMPSSLHCIQSEAFFGSKLREIHFQTGPQFIGSSAFAETKLEDVELPDSLITMSNSVFSDIPSLRRVSLPSTLKSLGGLTFDGDTALECIISHAIYPPKADDTDFGYFSSIGSDSAPITTGPDLQKCILLVPEESVNLYKESVGWNRFDNILSIESSGVNTLLEEANIETLTVEKGRLSIQCKKADRVELFNLGGIMLDSKSFEAIGTYRYEGNGPVIIRFNSISKVVNL